MEYSDPLACEMLESQVKDLKSSKCLLFAPVFSQQLCITFCDSAQLYIFGCEDNISKTIRHIMYGHERQTVPPRNTHIFTK